MSQPRQKKISAEEYDELAGRLDAMHGEVLSWGLLKPLELESADVVEQFRTTTGGLDDLAARFRERAAVERAAAP
jgi:hypothetical protein